MSIFYSLIARKNSTILVDADLSSGNYPQQTIRVLERNKLNAGLKTFVSQEFTHYLLNDPPYTFVCLTKSDFPKSNCIYFLKDIKQAFYEQIRESDRESSVAYSLSGKFGEHLKSRMKFFSDKKEGDPELKRLIAAMQETDDLMNKNIEDLNERGERLEILVNTNKQVKIEATGLDRRAHRLHKHYKWENVRKYVLMCALFVLVIYIVCTIFCGGFALETCVHSSN